MCSQTHIYTEAGYVVIVIVGAIMAMLHATQLHGHAQGDWQLGVGGWGAVRKQTMASLGGPGISHPTLDLGSDLSC